MSCCSCIHLVAFIFVALSCFLSLGSCVDLKIVNGRPTNITTAPYMVSLHNNGAYYCAGGLVNLQHVITAAHCLQNIPSNVITVGAGITDLRQTGQRRRVQRTFYPRAFNGDTKDMDIGIIRLRTAFVAGPTVGTIPLCTRPLTPGKQMRVSGWGLTSEQSKRAVDILRTATMPLVRFNYCARRYRSQDIRLTSTMVCAGLGQRDSCTGDSGAPGVINGELCTVVSFGLGCARRNYPGVYTNVNNQRIRRFINNVINS